MSKMFANNRSPLETLLPKEVVVVHTTESQQNCWQTGLLPAEQAFINTLVKKRQEEFTAGRNCARKAIQLLDGEISSILSGPHREPRFPFPFKGSISHCTHPTEQITVLPNERLSRRYCAAAIFNSLEAPTIKSVGIDVEANLPLDQSEEAIICTTREHSHICTLQQQSTESHWSKIIFSAKESFYKAQFWHTQRYLDFLEVEVSITPTKPLPPTDHTHNQVQRDCNANTNTPHLGHFNINVNAKDSMHPLGNGMHTGYYCCDKWFIYTAITLYTRPPS